jgi:hypothetical protein
MQIPLEAVANPGDGLLHVSLSDEQLKGLAEQICSSIKPIVDCRTCRCFTNDICSSTIICSNANLYDGLVAIRLWAKK